MIKLGEMRPEFTPDNLPPPSMEIGVQHSKRGNEGPYCDSRVLVRIYDGGQVAEMHFEPAVIDRVIDALVEAQHKARG